MGASTSRYELLHTRISRVTATGRRALKGDTSALASLRMSLRRLREVLPVLQLDPREVRKIDARLRKTAHRLKPIVRLDAALAQVDDLAAGAAGSRALDGRLKSELRRERVKLAVAKTLRKASADLKKALLKLTELSHGLKDARESAVSANARRWAIKARVARRAADLKQALADAGSVYVPGRLNVLRRAARRLRLGAELLAESGAHVGAADSKVLEQVHEALDRLRDSEALIRRLRRLQSELAPADLKVWQDLDALVLPLEYRSRRLHARYVRDRAALALAADRLGSRPTAAVSGRRKVS